MAHSDGVQILAAIRRQSDGYGYGYGYGSQYGAVSDFVAFQENYGHRVESHF